jgi:hypothetical protein
MDCLPSNDVSLRRVVGKYLARGRYLSPEQLEQALSPFTPFRGLAAFYLSVAARFKPASGAHRHDVERLAMGVSSDNGSISIAIPRAGRPLVITSAMPAARSARAACCARGVKTLSSVTSVPSTSARRSEIVVDGGTSCVISRLCYRLARCSANSVHRAVLVERMAGGASTKEAPAARRFAGLAPSAPAKAAEVSRVAGASDRIIRRSASSRRRDT